MTTRQYDYDAMRREYITSDISLRALADKHQVKAFSSVMRIARREGWNDQRSSFKTLEDSKTAEALAQGRANKIAEIERDTFAVIHAAVLNLGINMQDRWETDKVTGTRVFVPAQAVTPEGLVKLIDKYLVMSGGVTSREAHLGLDVSLGADDIPRDLLRSLRDLAVTKGAGSGPVGQSPLPRIEGPKQVN
jgi:hypothetical protein